ncbi:motility associated factor glycosyltransferase family protein [Shewanella maritima]|uniref:motility associated factor glycosyltransferase family protein n=1 Tax=Shewanella maritima TaxID=2520507 RepID=UPI003735AECD
MSELLESNLSIITQRWPSIAQQIQLANVDGLDAALVSGNNQTISVNGIQLSSRHDRLAEAQLLIENTIDDSATQAHVFGIGMGDVPSLLLDNQKLTSIDVYLLNAALLKLLLTYTDQSEWLTDDRVNLIDEPALYQLPNDFIPIAADLQLTDEEHAITRDVVVHQLNVEFANIKHQQNDPQINERISQTMPLIKRDDDAALLLERYDAKQVLVVAAGPTLETQYETIKHFHRQNGNVLICVDVAVKALVNAGITPDIIVTLDEKITATMVWHECLSATSLVYFPRTQPGLINVWKGPRYSAYTTSALYASLNAILPRLNLFANGSVFHPAADLAIKLSPRSVIFFGTDFSYPNNRTHAFWENGKLGVLGVETKKHWVINGKGEKVATDLNFRGYLRSLEQLISGHANIKFYQASEEGAKIHGVELLKDNYTQQGGK